MARIVNMADPDSAELFPSVDEANAAFLTMLDGWRGQGYDVVPNQHEENRYTVSDDAGQFIGEFYVEE